MGTVKTEEGGELKVDGSIEGNPSVLVDAVVVPDGEDSAAALMKDGDAKYYLRQAYKHLKAIGLIGAAQNMLAASGLPEDKEDKGLILEQDAKKLMKPLLQAMSGHRVWDREDKAKGTAA